MRHVPSLLLSNPLGIDDAQEIGLVPREYQVGEVVSVDDYVFATLIRTGYGVPYGAAEDVLLIGDGDPTAATGVDGQWYLDRLNEVLWGPKVGGLWPADPIRPDRGVQNLQLHADGHLWITYSTGTSADLGYIRGPAAPSLLATEYGAKGDAVADDTAALQAALNACPEGGEVLLAPGTYLITAPLVLRRNRTLRGLHAGRWTYDTGGPCRIRATTGFVGDALIRLRDEEDLYGTVGAAANGLYVGPNDQSGARITRLVLDGFTLTSGTGATPIDGIKATGLVRDVRLTEVGIRRCTGVGLRTAAYQRKDGKNYYPRGWVVSTLAVDGSGGDGVNTAYLNDSTLTDVHSGGNTGSGFVMLGAGELLMTNCRAPWNKGHGFYLTGLTYGNVVLSGCSTDRNEWHGCFIDASGQPIVLSACTFRRDGRNAKAGGGNYAGLLVSGATAPVTAAALTTETGVDDDATGSSSPQYGARVLNSRSVTVGSGVLWGQTGAYSDGGGNTNLRVSSHVVLATGPQATPTYSYLPDAALLRTALPAAGAAYTLALADQGRMLYSADATATTVTLPTNAVAAFPIGTWVEFQNVGGGNITVAAASGVTLSSPDGVPTTRTTRSVIRALKTATDTWTVYGDTNNAVAQAVTAATYNQVAGTLVSRDVSGNSSFGAVTLGAQPNVANTAARKDYVDGQVATRIAATDKGAANGVATLGADSKIPLAQLPSSIPTSGGGGSSTSSFSGAVTPNPDPAQPVDVTINSNWGITDTQVNLVPNPQVAASTQSWFGNAGTGAAVTATRGTSGGPAGGVGTYYRQTYTAAGTSAAGTDPGASIIADGRASAALPIPVTAGTVYSAAIYTQSSIAQRLDCRIQWYDAAGTLVGTSPGAAVTVAANTWTQLTVAGVAAPAGALYARVAVATSTGAGAVPYPSGATFDATMAQLTATAAVPTYFDGTSGGGAWTGTANASSSTRSPYVYYDDAGAADADAGILVPDVANNTFGVFRPGGPWIPDVVFSLNGQRGDVVLDAVSSAQLTSGIAGGVVTAQQRPGNTIFGPYTPTLADAGRLVMLNSATAVNLTLPANSAVAFPLGTVIEIGQTGAGTVTVAPAAGVTVNAPDGLSLRKQYSRATLVKTAADTWQLAGDLADDTGRINFTPNTPITVGPQGAYYRRVGKIVEFCLESTYTSSFTASFTFFTLPVGFRPYTNRFIQAVTYGSGSTQWAINNDGTVQYAGVPNATPGGMLMSTLFMVA